MDKLKQFFVSSKNKKIISISMVACMIFAMSCCFAGDGETTTPDFSPITDALTSVITPTMLITIIAATITVGSGFVLMWFGYRKLKSAFVKGFTKGKL